MPSNDLDMNNDRRLASPFDLNGTGDQGAVMNFISHIGCSHVFASHFYPIPTEIIHLVRSQTL